MFTRLRIFLNSLMPCMVVPQGRTCSLVPVAILFLSSCFSLSIPAYAAGPSGTLEKQVVPARAIQLKEGRDVAWKALWDQGRELARSGRLVEAVPVYEALLVMREGLEVARGELVNILFQLKREGEALPHLELLVESAPRNVQYLLALAEVSRAQGNAARTVELYKRVLQREPENLQALRGTASALLAQQKKLEAAVILEILLQREPARLSLREELGNLYYGLGDYDKARPHLTALARESQADPAILLKTAHVYDKAGLEIQAVEYWQRLARLSPGTEAKERLAAYYLKGGGKGEEALSYLLPLLEKESASSRLFKRLGQIYLNLSRFPEALVYLERYIAMKPEDKETLRQLIDIQTVMANRHGTVVSKRGLSPGFVPDLKNMERVAGLYETNGDIWEAVALYGQILMIIPDDQQILAKRARALLVGGNDNKSDAMWAELEREQKLLGVLEILFQLIPKDSTVLKKLASIYLERGELVKSLEMFSHLEALGVRTPEILTGQALALERLGRPARALSIYEQLLDGADKTGRFRLRCIQLAGRLGLLKKTHSHLARLQAEFPRLLESPQTQLLIARALIETASYGAAREYYLAILARYPDDQQLTSAAFLGIGEVYRQSGLPYEAEQALRQAYLQQPQDKEAMARLFALALEERRFAEARVWLGRLRQQDDQRQDAGDLPMISVPGKEDGPDRRLLQARLLAAEGATGGALKLLRQFKTENGPLPPFSLLRQEIDLLYARLLLADGRYAQAEQVAVSLSGKHDALAADLLLLHVYRLQEKNVAANELFQRILAEFSQDQGLVLVLLQAMKEEGLLTELGERAELAGRQYPESVTIRALAAYAREANGELGSAMAIWQALVRDFPQQEFVVARLAQELFRRGRFAEAKSLAERFPQVASRPDMVLLKARQFWAEHEWGKAIDVYDSFLLPSVADSLGAQSGEQGVALPREEGPGLWTKLTVAATDRQTMVDVLMTPESVLETGPEAMALNRLAVPFYARYRWHKQFALEKIARQAVMRREYLAAANYLQALLREYPMETSLRFDLAGIYSRFGQLGHEAALYEEIKAADGDFPGLTEARQRNTLKRQPKTSIGYGYLKEEGRDGYKAIKKSWGEASLQASPSLQHDLEVNLARLDYREPDGKGKISGTRALVAYSANINEHLLLRGEGGAEMLENSQADTTLFGVAAEGRLGDRLTGIISYGRDVVHDTLASLGRKIVQQDYRANFVLDMMPNIQTGGGYLRASFSDDNTMKGYDLWAAYLLFFEPALLKFSYTYDFKDSAEARDGGPLQADGFAALDHPYWTPMNYWQNRFSVYFKHQLSGDQFRRGTPRHYDLEYALTYDEKGYAMQTMKGGFFVEYTPQVIFAARTALTSGSEYRSKEVFLSAVYRW